MPFERLRTELLRREVRKPDKIIPQLEHMEEKGHDTEKLVDLIHQLPEGLNGMKLLKILNRNLNIDYYNSKLMLEHLASIPKEELSRNEELLTRLADKHHEARNDAMKDIFWIKHESELRKLGFENKEQLKSWDSKFLFKLLEYDPNHFKVIGSTDRDIRAVKLAVQNADNFRDYFEGLPGTKEVVEDLKSIGVDTNVWDSPKEKYEHTIFEDDKRKQVIEINMWDRNPKSDLFIAEGSTDCSSITAPQFWNRVPQLMDKAISIFRINKKTIDKEKGKERVSHVGQLYTMATKDRENRPVLSVEAIEVSKDVRSSDKLLEGIDETIHNYARKCNFQRIALDSAVSARDWVKDYFVEKHGANKPRLVELEKSGGFEGGNQNRLDLNDLYYQMFVWHAKPEGHVLSHSWVTDLNDEHVPIPEIQAQPQQQGGGFGRPPMAPMPMLEGEQNQLFQSIMRGVDDGFMEALRESPPKNQEALAQLPPPRTIDALDKEHTKLVRGITEEVLSQLDAGKITRDQVTNEVKQRLKQSVIAFNRQVDENPPPKTPAEIKPYIKQKMPDPRGVGMRAIESALREHYA